GFMAWGYLLLSQGRPEYMDNAVECLDWLDRAKESGQIGHSWGNHFDFSTRSGRMHAHTPTIVWSSLIGQAFLVAFEQTNNNRYIDIAEEVCPWILAAPRECTAQGSCLSYTATHQNSVHNSNLLGAGMLARTWKHRPNPEYKTIAQQAVSYSCAR